MKKNRGMRGLPQASINWKIRKNKRNAEIKKPKEKKTGIIRNQSR